MNLFTIGHSTHTLEAFLALLERHAIAVVADVRSSPYGRLDHFHREFLQAALRNARINYVFLGRELGARRDEAACYEGDQAVYPRIAKLPLFQEGLVRVRRGIARQRVALLCAEKEPLACHRTILVCRHLRGPDVHIAHILANGELEQHVDAERRLVKDLELGPTLFDLDLDERVRIEEAYERRGRQIAYRRGSEESGDE